MSLLLLMTSARASTQWKTVLMLEFRRFLRDKYSLAAVTIDIFTKEDGEFLVKNGALPEDDCYYRICGTVWNCLTQRRSDAEALAKSARARAASSLWVINKTDLAAAVGQDVSVMERDALCMRDGGPFVFPQIEMMSEAIDETFDKDEAEEET